MDRIIGIDYGRKRVGVAVSDPLGIFASALETVHSAKIIDYLKKYAENENVVRFVVGYPVNMNGFPSDCLELIALTDLTRGQKVVFRLMLRHLEVSRHRAVMQFLTLEAHWVQR